MKGRILVVEDDSAHRMALERHLSRSGYEVVSAESAERALGTLSQADPDVVLTDIRMGEMDGFELLAFLREHRRDLDVILMTAHDDVQGAIDAMKGGAFDYMLKPLDLDVLDETVERCFRDRRERGRGRRKEGSEPPTRVHGLVGRDPRMVEIYKLIGTVAATKAPVLIRGETGTGKEMIARTIHANSRDSSEPFVAVNCTAIPENLLESELFGHVKGSFTGAVNDRRGRFELAAGGTIFLDEIGDTEPAFQAKLLRVLQEREFYPVGSEQPRRTNARVIAATHRPVERLIDEGRFREDLYFRLRVVEIVVPPLRERPSDIPLLARSILVKVNGEYGRNVHVIPDAVMAALLTYAWPGNVRELENALTRAALLARGPALSLEHLTLGTAEREEVPADAADDSLDEMERIHVQRVLAKVGGNKSKAAEILGVSRPRLNRIIEKYDIVV
ncbi:MAG TPA: sigma-54 dependent transcriptional regulator [Longimicrobiales bacterium]|nr:sigma-54 dependent transcriptional regulator [Longimicrobiales bacterium]